MIPRLWLGASLILIAASACAGPRTTGEQPVPLTSPHNPPTVHPTTQVSPGSALLTRQETVVAGHHTEVVAVNKRVVYRHLSDHTNPPEVTCYDQCSIGWRPVVVDGSALSVVRLDRNNVGSVVRADGYVQLTYRGAPLYLHPGKSVSSTDDWEVVMAD
ncbi:hypothetical protein [Kribbella sp. NPDC055071]